MIALQFVIPEIFLAVSIFILLLVGVFIKNSFGDSEIFPTSTTYFVCIQTIT